MYTAATEIYTYLHTLSLHDSLPILFRPRRLSLTREARRQFDVRRPTELADRLDPIECIATLYQFLCIACKRTGITRNISNLWHNRLRKRGRLVAGTRTRRNEHHRPEQPETGRASWGERVCQYV